MNLVRFGDVEPGTIWRLPEDDAWWLKVNVKYVYSECRKEPLKDRGWSIQIAGPGAKEFAGLLFWTCDNSRVIVWDGKEALK